MSSPVIISLTSIPSRMHMIGPVLESLTRQEANIDRVILWVPETYRRKGFEDFVLPAVPDGVEIRRSAVDYGPATKVLPAVRAFADQDVRILYCDDDRIYDRNWAGQIIAESDRFPDHCICEDGETLLVTKIRAFRTTKTYKLLQQATFGLFPAIHRKLARWINPDFGHVDVAKGYGGVLIRPHFLCEDAFDIPEHLWAVDDFWLSGQMTLKGVPIRKMAARPNSKRTSLMKVDALFDFVHEGLGRDAANLACIEHFRALGIWQTSRGAHSPFGS